jgi:hypothetical protein
MDNIREEWAAIVKKHSELLGSPTSSIVWNFEFKKTQRFGNWDSFRCQVKRDAHTLLSPLERANLMSSD